MRGLPIAAFVATAILLTQTSALSQTLGAGEVTDFVVSAFDPAQTYAVYLPSAYDARREWPLLVAMDPRGRALVPLERFLDAAERFGYVVVSSYNTRSDVFYDANTPALNAILNDAVRMFSIDRSRIYLTGQSGTARRGWVFASLVPGGAAGLIGFGAGLATGLTLPDEVPFPFFGSAGTTDYNYDEMLELARLLDQRGARHAFVAFDGSHEWGDRATCMEALGWMELQAMLSGLRTLDTDLLAELHTERKRAAEEKMASGDLYGAYLRYEAIVKDFTGLHDVSEAERAAFALRVSDLVHESIETVKRLRVLDRSFAERLANFFHEIQTGDTTPMLAEALVELRIKHVKHLAGDAEELLESQQAQRHLEKIFVNTVFYGPRDLLQRRQPLRALVMLRIAESIRPNDPEVLLGLARAHAQLAQNVEAMRALERLEQFGVLNDSDLDEDPYLQPLRDVPEFQSLRARQRVK